MLHEARHAYQGLQAVSSNDGDGDFLLKAIQVAPFNVVIDSSEDMRTVCDQMADALHEIHYKGDQSFDQPGEPDYANWAWEMDAWVFCTSH